MRMIKCFGNHMVLQRAVRRRAGHWSLILTFPLFSLPLEELGIVLASERIYILHPADQHIFFSKSRYKVYLFYFYFFISYLFYTYQYIHVNPNLPIHHTTPTLLSPLGVHTFVLYICVSISALQTGSPVPFFQIPHICVNIQQTPTF